MRIRRVRCEWFMLEAARKGDRNYLPVKVRPHRQKFSRTTWYNMVMRHRHKTCCGSVDGMGDVCRATFYVVWPCCATQIVKRQMSVHFKRNSCDIMVSQRCCVLSDVIWTYFCHFLRCSRAKFIKKIVDVRRLVAQQLFAWPRHVLCRTTLLYKVVWLNCCPCGCTLIRANVFFMTVKNLQKCGFSIFQYFLLQFAPNEDTNVFLWIFWGKKNFI